MIKISTKKDIKQSLVTLSLVPGEKWSKEKEQQKHRDRKHHALHDQ